MMHIEISQLIRIGSLPKNLDTLKGLCFMRIAILGAGAMGMLFGGHLSRKNEVTLIDIDQQKVDAVNQNGITIWSIAMPSCLFFEVTYLAWVCLLIRQMYPSMLSTSLAARNERYASCTISAHKSSASS